MCIHVYLPTYTHSYFFSLLETFEKYKNTKNVTNSISYLNIIKAKCEKPTASIILNSKRLNLFPLGSGIR